MPAFYWMSQGVEGILIFKVDARAEQPIEQAGQTALKGNSTMTGASIIGELSGRGIEGT